MTEVGENGKTIIRKAEDIGDLGAIKLLPLCNLYVEPVQKVREFQGYLKN